MRANVFAARMAELDAVLAACRDRSPFADSEVRDTSNRSSRDWPWWSVEVVQKRIDGNETRRATASVRLASTHDGHPDQYQANWRAEIWRDSGIDTYDRRGEAHPRWHVPTADQLCAIIDDLLTKAWRSIAD